MFMGIVIDGVGERLRRAQTRARAAVPVDDASTDTRGTLSLSPQSESTGYSQTRRHLAFNAT